MDLNELLRRLTVEFSKERGFPVDSVSYVSARPGENPFETLSLVATFTDSDRTCLGYCGRGKVYLSGPRFIDGITWRYDVSHLFDPVYRWSIKKSIRKTHIHVDMMGP